MYDTATRSIKVLHVCLHYHCISVFLFYYSKNEGSSHLGVFSYKISCANQSSSQAETTF